MLGTSGLPLVFKAAASSANAAPSITNSDTADSASNVSVFTLTQAAAQVAGNSILVFVWWQDTTAVPGALGMTDTSLNTYVNLGHLYDSTVGLQSVVVFLATNIASAVAGTNVITMHWTGTATLPELKAHQITSSSYDSGTLAFNKAASGNSTESITTTHGNDLVIGYSAPANDTVKSGGTGTLTAGSPSSQGAGSAYQTQATAGPTTVTINLTNATNAWDIAALGLYTP